MTYLLTDNLKARDGRTSEKENEPLRRGEGEPSEAVAGWLPRTPSSPIIRLQSCYQCDHTFATELKKHEKIISYNTETTHPPITAHFIIHCIAHNRKCTAVRARVHYHSPLKICYTPSIPFTAGLWIEVLFESEMSTHSFIRLHCFELDFKFNIICRRLVAVS